MRCRANDVPIPRENFIIVRSVPALRPSTVTDNLREEGGVVITS